ncbi:MAG: Mrp/NBP35 family ATP-binding protein [Bacilli bacterium]|nr:Mrp/NBP35 family ATP-binding protein [Bacilli bacterium]
MADCDNNCSSCGVENCESRKALQKDEMNEFSHVKKIIGVVSGKGGVGKSLVTSLLAVNKHNEGKEVAILDADITGPSIPQCFGVHGQLMGDGEHIFPSLSKGGIKIVSSNLILEHETDPVIWRGPIIANLVRQFYTEVAFGDVDYMFVDMPPGTGDVPLTVFQSMKVDGIVIVTSPQDLVSMIVAKAINMANQMNIPVLGIVENMSYVVCPDCGKHIEVFGHSKLEEVAKKHNLKILGRIPIDQKLADACDRGDIESIKDKYFDIDF